MENKDENVITFNPCKHHYYFINEQILDFTEGRNKNLLGCLKKIGNNLLDLYLGQLTINEIYVECIETLKQREVYEKEAFFGWLKPSGYRKIELSDKSVWVVRKGENEEKFVHIHPAKNSLWTTRVRASTLKTVIALKINHPEKTERNKLFLDEVNKVRTNILQLSPIKKLEKNKGILKLWNLFTP